MLQTTGTVSKVSSPIILKEFTTNGAAGITDSLPSTGATPIQTSGVFGGSEGFLTTSTDNKYIVLGGYGTSGSFTDITGTASSSVPRVIGTVASSGAYQQVGSSSTAYSNNDIRGAISDEQIIGLREHQLPMLTALIITGRGLSQHWVRQQPRQKLMDYAYLTGKFIIPQKSLARVIHLHSLEYLR